MKKWGIIITVFYGVALVIFLAPLAYLLLRGHGFHEIVSLRFTSLDVDRWLSFIDKYIRAWYGWLITLVMVTAQALLLFLSVDLKFRPTKPRSHVLVSIITATFLFGLLSMALFGSLIAVVAGDKTELWYFLPAVPIIMWVIWAFLFYLYCRDTGGDIARIVSWLLKGSVLELLVAVPSHLIVRSRNECSAPLLTNFGIVTGIAIMLLAFGPSVLILYKKRLDERLIKSG